MKIIYSFLTLLCFFSFNMLRAQPKIRQQKIIQGPFSDYASCIINTNDHGYLLGGYSNSNAGFDKTEDSRDGYNDIWIVKLDSVRNILWDKTIGGSGVDILNNCIQTSDGGFMLCGASTSGISGEKTDTLRGSSDIWIVKLDSNHNILWDKTIGGEKNSTNYGAKISQTTDGGYIIGSQTQSGIGGEKTQRSRGLEDLWIIKLDSAGTIEWDRTIGGNDADYFRDIMQTTDGGYIVGAESKSNISGEKTANSKGSSDYWIIKLNKRGKVEWDKTIGGNDVDILQSVAQTDDKGYIIGGSSISTISGDKTKGRTGLYDYWIVKLDSTANIEWDNDFGGGRSDFLTKIKQTKLGGYILCGYSYSFPKGEKSEENRGPISTYDYWLIRANKAGKFLWDKTIGGSVNDKLVDLVEINANRFALFGHSNSPISGDKTQRGNGNGYHYWFVELQYVDTSNSIIVQTETNNITSPKNNQSKFIAYPNPAKNILYVNSSSASIITLIDLQGKLLLSKTINGNATIDVSKYTPGTYFLKNNATGQVEKIIITGK